MKGCVRNSGNFAMRESDFEKVNPVSVTVPDESMTIKQIVDRFTKGQTMPIGDVKDPSYVPDVDFDSEDLEKVKDMDLHDLQEYRERLADQAYEIEEELKKRKEAQEAKSKAEAEELEEIRAELKARKKSSGAKGGGKGRQGVATQGSNDAADDADDV